MISKNEFVEILAQLQEAQEVTEKVNQIFKNSKMYMLNDFADCSSLMICHDDIVVKLLDNMFNTDLVEYWVYELNYGKEYKEGSVINADGSICDISTPEKLYDILKEDFINENNNKI